MSYLIVNQPEVYNDINEISNYYKKINRSLAFKFLEKLEEAKNYLVEFPESFQTKYNNVRTLKIDKFPYHLHFIIDKINEQIVILAIIHTYKNPKDYTKR